MKRICITKDLKGVKMNPEIKDLVNLINEGDCTKLNTYTLRCASGETREAYEDITYYALKSGMFQRSRYYEGNPRDLQRISYFLSGLFNATIYDTMRFLRGMYLFERFGLNTLEILT